MTAYTSLLLPILVSAVAVFIVSSVLHTALPWHHKDWKQLPNEGDVQDAMRKAGVTPGDYMLPFPGGEGGMKNPTFRERMTAGPQATMIVRAGGMPNMGAYLGKWFAHLVVVSALCAFNVAHAAEPGGDTHRVFHFVALPAFLAYGLALWQDQIWYGKSTATSIRNTIDALLYALVTAFVFMWMWPKS
jgi:hypothetical protein